MSCLGRGRVGVSRRGDPGQSPQRPTCQGSRTPRGGRLGLVFFSSTPSCIILLSVFAPWRILDLETFLGWGLLPHSQAGSPAGQGLTEGAPPAPTSALDSVGRAGSGWAWPTVCQAECPAPSSQQPQGQGWVTGGSSFPDFEWTQLSVFPERGALCSVAVRTWTLPQRGVGGLLPPGPP